MRKTKTLHMNVKKCIYGPSAVKTGVAIPKLELKESDGWKAGDRITVKIVIEREEE